MILKMDDGKRVSIAFLTNGGAGNLFCQLNFIYCFYHHFKEEDPRIVVFGHKSDELNRLLMADADFIDEFFSSGCSDKGYECDAFIHLEFFPDVLILKDSLNEKAPGIYDQLSIYAAFMKDKQKRYGAMHPFVNHNAYVWSINNHRNVLSSYDVDGAIGVSGDYSWHPDIRTDTGLLESLGLSYNQYITLQRGATPGLSTKESPKIWSKQHYEELIALLKAIFPEKKIVQLGEKDNSEALFGVDINLLGKTSWKELGMILKGAWLHIDGECGMVHYRRCLTDRPSVVLFGPTPMRYYGYDGNINIKSASCRDFCARLTNSWLERCARGFDKAPCLEELRPGTVLGRIVLWNQMQCIKNDDSRGMIEAKNRELYEKYIIDEEYKRNFLDSHYIYYFREELIPLEDLRIFTALGNGREDFVPLENTAAYKAVLGDWESYEKYLKTLNEYDGNNIHSPERFMKLLESLDDAGLEDDRPIFIDADNRVLDGQHRLAWYAGRNGINAQIIVVRIYSLTGANYDYFPFDEVKRGEKVVIYGIGKVGRSYIRQILETDYCRIAAVVDRNPEAWDQGWSEDDIECVTPDAFSELGDGYDKVVVAVRNYRHAEEIMEALERLGVPRAKVISPCKI